MIKSLGFCVGVSVAVLGACSGNSPQDECNKIANVACSKLYACVDSATIQTKFGFTSQGECVTTTESTYKCSTAKDSCPAGTTYNGAQADVCVNDYNNLSCNQLASGTQPLSCSTICQ